MAGGKKQEFGGLYKKEMKTALVNFSVNCKTLVELCYLYKISLPGGWAPAEHRSPDWFSEPAAASFSIVRLIDFYEIAAGAVSRVNRNI